MNHEQENDERWTMNNKERQCEFRLNFFTDTDTSTDTSLSFNV
jgi:hypothetical protein